MVTENCAIYRYDSAGHPEEAKATVIVNRSKWILYNYNTIDVNNFNIYVY
jgi:hypothetical protein